MANLRLHEVLQRRLKPGPHSTKRIVNQFADEFGLVYFGYVSQRSDEHHIVRGMTVSTNHHDDHYCIGTFDTYDVVFVERSDTLRNGKKHQWHIMEFDLKSQRDIPHIFIGSDRHGLGFHELLRIKYPILHPVELGVTGAYPTEFTGSFSLYCAPAHVVDAEALLPPDVAHMIGTHFEGLAVEITNDSLYVYSERTHLTPALLATMLKNGAWLAERLDQKNQHP